MVWLRRKEEGRGGRGNVGQGVLNRLQVILEVLEGIIKQLGEEDQVS